MRRPHYAWAICFGSALMLFTVIGLGANVFSVYQPYIITRNNFTNAQGAWIITVRSLFILIGMMTATWFCRKIGLRRTAGLSVLLIAGACFIFGLAHTFPMYCLAALVTGLGYGWGGMIPASLLIDRWFQDRQTFALGLSATGSGLATILAPAPLTFLIESFSLRTAFWCEGAFALLCGIIIWIVVRDGPEDMGMTPYRAAGMQETPHEIRTAPAGMTRRYWLIALAAVFLIGPSTSLGLSNLGVLYSTEGFAPGVVAALISVMGLALIIGKLIYGQVVDRVGGRRSNYLIYTTMLIGFALCCLAHTGSTFLAFAAAAFFGLGLPISCVSLSVWAKDCRGDRDFADGLKWCQTMFALGIFLFGPVPGILADRFGNYVPAFIMFFAMLLVSMLLMCWVYAKTGAGAPPAKTAKQ